MKIGMSNYSLRNYFTRGKFSFTDFSFINDLFPDIQGLELIADNLEARDLDEEVDVVKSAAEDCGLEWFALTTGSGEFGANAVPHWHHDAEYMQGFDRMLEFRIGYGLEWIEKAAEVGIGLMRIDCSSFVFNHKIPVTKAIDWNIQQNVLAYEKFCKAGKENGIEIGIENHGGFASDLSVLERLFDAVPELKLCFDIGNLPDSDRIRIIEKFGDRINFVHAKTYEFDEQGCEKYFDYEMIIGKLKDAGFNGWMSIEFEGPGDQIEGVKKTTELLKKYI